MDYASLSVKELKAVVCSHIGEALFSSKKFSEKSEIVAFLKEYDEDQSRHPKKSDSAPTEGKKKRDRTEPLSNTKQKNAMSIPAGKYILGDPCYLCVDVCDLEKFNETYFEPEDDDDLDFDKGEPRFNESTPVIAFNTVDATPSYYCDKKNLYCFQINTGVIALVPLRYHPTFAADEASVVEFLTPTTCYAAKGVLHFGDISIDTVKTRKTPHKFYKGKGQHYLSEEEEEVDEEEEQVEEEEEESEFVDSDEDEKLERQRKKKRKKERKKEKKRMQEEATR